MINVFVGLPLYGGVIHTQTMVCLFNELLDLIAHGYTPHIEEISGCSLPHTARNILATRFMESECSHLIFVDHDIVWPVGTMRRFIEANDDLVAGVYPARMDPETYFIGWADEHDEIWSDHRGLIEVDRVPAGLSCTSRGAFQKVIDTFAGIKGKHDGFEDGLYRFYDHFDTPDGYQWGEDMAFCRRLRTAGGRVWVDPDIDLGHIGTKTFRGNFGQWLRAEEVKRAKKRKRKHVA